MPDSFAPTRYPPDVWRVIIHRSADGSTNMAIDEAIARQVGAGGAPPTLRFYEWSPPCLSLGYSQPITDVDHSRLQQRGWDLVRRLTGGRAILHTDELTYSLAIPPDDPRVKGSIVESYRRLSRGLLNGLERLGAQVQSDRARADAHSFKGPVCFEVPSDYELTLDGRKLIGSAQTRRADAAVLQHGTLPLTGDLRRICDALVFDSEQAREVARTRVLERAITLQNGLGAHIDFPQAAQALQKGFADALNFTFHSNGLTPAEQDLAEKLRTEKYAHPSWTNRY